MFARGLTYHAIYGTVAKRDRFVGRTNVQALKNGLPICSRDFNSCRSARALNTRRRHKFGDLESVIDFSESSFVERRTSSDSDSVRDKKSVSFK